jgi:hypothetical protein
VGGTDLMPALCASATTSAADMVAGKERTNAAFVVCFFVDVGAVFLSMLDHVLLIWLEVTTGSAPAQLGRVITTPIPHGTGTRRAWP